MIEKKYIEMEGVFSGSRVINIYLPDDYNERRKKYPVLYMFDGHNLFFDEEAAFGKSWGMKEYLDSNNVQLIVVGIQCSFEGNERVSEYSPYNLDNYNGEFIVPEGKYFFLGDNRYWSLDSRYWNDPYIDGSEIKGKAQIKVYPWKDFGKIE